MPIRCRRFQDNSISWLSSLLRKASRCVEFRQKPRSSILIRHATASNSAQSKAQEYSGVHASDLSATPGYQENISRNRLLHATTAGGIEQKNEKAKVFKEPEEILDVTGMPILRCRSAVDVLR